jgi:hypothetical protein
MRINSFDQVKAFFDENKCDLLENCYINAHTKMKYRCSCGNVSFINFNNFKSGKRCGCKRIDNKTLKQQNIKNKVEKKGHKFLKSEFVNGKYWVDYICKCGEHKKKQISSINKSDGCSNCLRSKFSFTHDYVEKFFIDHGCKLLSNTYKNARTKLKYICSCGNESEIVFDSFRRGNRCRKCGSKRTAEYLSKNRRGKNSPVWIEDREKKKENECFCERCRSMVRIFLKKINIKKNNHTEILLGYSPQDLKNHIKNHSNWEKVKNENWQIDHIFPLTAFVEYGIKDIKLANSLENLQPLSKKDNIKKTNKYDKKSFENWLISKGVMLQSINT